MSNRWSCSPVQVFLHLYTGIDNGLFAKYGLNVEHIYIQVSAPSLAAVQRVVTVFAETLHFVEKNPKKAKAAVAKAMHTNDARAGRASYDVCAKKIVDRRMIIPAETVAETCEQTRLSGGVVRRKAAELYDNSFCQPRRKQTVS